MIDINKHKLLRDNVSTLKETSIDTHDNNNIKYMTASEREAINFDNVKKEYIKNLALTDEPKSNDALFINKNDDLVFVEFKNGYMDTAKK